MKLKNLLKWWQFKGKVNLDIPATTSKCGYLTGITPEAKESLKGHCEPCESASEKLSRRELEKLEENEREIKNLGKLIKPCEVEKGRNETK